MLTINMNTFENISMNNKLKLFQYLQITHNLKNFKKWAIQEQVGYWASETRYSWTQDNG